tara:strand:- start:21845 stop:23620 length:1776 start_codon:yes stop_codon:yes gene_type:complete
VDQGSLIDKRIRYRTADLNCCHFDEDVPALLQRIYAGRGVVDQQELSLGLAELPPPDQLHGLGEAVRLLTEALRGEQSILVIGDFDADGATSTVVAVLALRSMGCRRVDFLVPNRFQYGYGLTPEIAALAGQRRPDLIITVDNGISSHAGVTSAKALGMKVLITDHHLPGADLPKADAIVNPHQRDCLFPGKNLAGVGVIFYLMSALRSHLRDVGWFTDQHRAEPNLARWLDLVALGTVADVVTLDKINRVLVAQGVRRIQAGQARPGILALLELANRDHRHLVAADLGFAVGPRLNAAGRLEDMSIGINCLLTDDVGEARRLALQLDELNRDRRTIEADMEREALSIVSALRFDEDTMPWGLCLMDAQWHQGVVGLLASRIKDRFHRPVIAFAKGNDSDLKGSARSIPGLHIRDVLDTVAAENPGLVDKFGGHAMAAGLSLPANNFDRFAMAFDTEVRRLLTAADLEAEIITDGELEVEQLNLAVAQQLRAGGPWGQQFPEPSFYGKFNVIEHRIVGERHLKLTLGCPTEGGQLVDAIAFGAVDKHELADLPAQLAMVYRLDVNEYRGRQSVQLLVEKLLIPLKQLGVDP